MGEVTKIAWCDHTFNPWIGCTKVSPGCAHCYAETQNARWNWNGGGWGPGAVRKVTSAANWRNPVKWERAARKAGVRAKVFCASLADVFEAEAPVQARRDLWNVIGDTCDALDWMLLTKRPERITEVMCDDGLNLGFFELAHCWLGASTENQAAADKRIPALLDVDAAVHFISAGPLLGPIDLDSELVEGLHALRCGGGKHCACGTVSLDLVICEGESGPGARVMHADWVRSLHNQSNEAGLSFFFKQWGDHKEFGSGLPGHPKFQAGYRPGAEKGGSLLDGREWKEFPVA